MILYIKETKDERIETQLNHFRPDRQDGKGFDMFLLSLDKVYIDLRSKQVNFASRDWAVRANWLTSKLQKWFGVN